MRKIILLFVLMMGLGVAHAQDVVEVAPAQITEVEGFNPASKRVYAELSASSRPFSTKVNVAIDFGQSTSWLGAMSESMIVDKNGKEIKFNSMIDAMNYLASSAGSLPRPMWCPMETRATSVAPFTGSSTRTLTTTARLPKAS